MEEKNQVDKVTNSYAPGKIILGGEHAVVYGYPAIALTINRGVNVSISQIKKETFANKPNGPVLKAKCKKKAKNPNLHKKITPATKIALCELVRIFGGKIEKLELVIDSTISIGKGLGSSAALSVALVKGVSLFLNKNITIKEIFNSVMKLEKAFHGNPSGIDHAAIINEGLIWFKKNKNKSTTKKIKSNCDINFLICVTPRRKNAIEAIKQMQKKTRSHKCFCGETFKKIGTIVEDMRKALADGDSLKLGKLMNANQKYLGYLGISTRKLDEACMIANRAGALGSKLTGAGEGGAAMFLVKKNWLQVFSSLKSAGYFPFLALPEKNAR